MSVATARPTVTPDSSAVQNPTRADGYLGAFVSPLTSKELFLAAEGSYFTACSPTPGTGVIGHAAPTTFDEAKPYFLCYNGSSLNLYPQFLHLYETVASIGGTRVQLTQTIDNGNRYSSAGTAMTVNNTNMYSSNSGALVACYQGAVVATAASGTRRLLGNTVFRGGVIDIIQDFYQLVWGAPDGTSSVGSRVATVGEFSRVCPPVCVGPGQSLLLTQWVASQSTGPTWEALFGFVLR